MQDDNSYYVGLHEPKLIRKELLLASKDLITVLKRVEEVGQLSEEKEKEMERLHRLIDQVKLILKKLRSTLPKQKLPARMVKKVKAKQTVLARPKPATTMKKPMAKPKPAPKKQSKIDLLEEELAKIEDKLGKLEH